MPNYCVNSKAQPGSGDHEVHNVDENGSCLPSQSNRVPLGYYSSCDGAVRAARAYYGDVNGCYYCARDCHTT